MSIEIVRGELERLFSLDELMALSSEVLGLPPESVGGTASKASFARALVERCAEIHALPALLDALVTERSEVDAKLRELAKSPSGVPTDELKPGASFGAFTIVRKLADGPRATTYLAKRDGQERVLKVHRAGLSSDAAAVQRFLAQLRLGARLNNEGLPAGVEAGLEGPVLWSSYAHVDAQPLSARISRTGPLHLNEARALLRGVLGALSALHEAKLAHGAVKLENVLVGRGASGTPRAILVDQGSDKLGSWAYALATPSSLRGLGPDQLLGRPADPAGDLWAFGALAYELLSGKAPFQGASTLQLGSALTGQPPAPPSQLAPRGWVVKELDELLARLLDKNAGSRPKSAAQIIEMLEGIGKPSTQSKISDSEIDTRIDALVADPTSHEAALALETAIEQGADPKRVAEAFSMAADQLEVPEGEGHDKQLEAKKSLLFRAARLHESAKDKEGAEAVYITLSELDPDDEIAQTALEDVRRELGKHEELIEMLLGRSERSESHSERARALNQIGHLYVRELDDREQGVFAYAQALAQDVQNDDYAQDLERAAGTDMKLWTEALQICSEATTHPRMPTDVKVTLYLRLGRWYSDKVARPDLGLPCFQAVLQLDAANDGALAGMSSVYRRAQQWQELGQVLLRRADRAATPDRARSYRAEAADLLEKKLNDPGRARDLYEQIFAEDPSNDAAVEALARIYQQVKDDEGYARILERRADALRGEARVEALCKIAELYEDRLDNLPEAFRRYEAVLDHDAHSLTALRGLDRILNRMGRYGELLDNLEKQLTIAATPRQKITLLERMAGIHDEEFLDHEKASRALERILEIDPSHEGALTALVRHYRSLDRWEDVASLYERQLKIVSADAQRVDVLLALGRVLVEHVGSPQRAQRAYERVLEIDPDHGSALESLANVRVQSGDAMAALAAVESLAEKSDKPEQKSDHWIRAARILEERGDKDGAIERYKLALEAHPSNSAASQALRKAYLARGDAASAAELVTREIDSTEGNLAKARLYGELALLYRDKVKDKARATEAATKAVDLDPTSLVGLMVSGDLAYDAGRFLEAAKHYEMVVGRADALPQADAVRVVVQYIEALSRTGSTDKALGTVDTLMRLAPDSPDALASAARVLLDAADAKRALELFEKLLDGFGDKLSPRQRADALLGVGDARHRLGDLDGAIAPLNEAADLDPESSSAIDVLCRVHEAKGDYEEFVRIKTRRLDALGGEARTNLLLEIGDVCFQKLNDRTRASKSYVAALDERPDDRRVLTKLMQLYSEEKDWSRLVEVVLKLASMVSDAKQKAKYMHTAAIVAGRQMGEPSKAAAFYDEVLELDPSLDKALSEAIEVRAELGDHEGVERLLKLQLDQATDAGDRDKMLSTFDKLGYLYRDKLGWTGEAIDAFEAAQTLDAEDAARNELLATLYASDPAQYLDKAVAAQRPILRKNPGRPEPYRLLRKLYTESKRADAAWCLCQALSVMNLAEPDEERFYRRMRPEMAAAAQSRLGNDDWEKLTHEGADPLVTAIFALIEPAVLRRNAQPLEALGYQPGYALDLARHPYPMSQTIFYAAGVLGMDPPLCFQNPQDPGGLSFLNAHQPGIVLGAAALSHDLPGQPAAFIAARHLTYYRPGLYIRHLVATGTALRAWLFAAIKLIVPAFPITPELEGAVGENLALLESTIVGHQRDVLTSVVTKLLGAGAIDLKRWVGGVDLTADRAALILTNDLEIAIEMIRASDEGSAAIVHRERIKELILFATSEEFFSIRRKLGVNIDA
jgi:tetratricopeptide (TPR) repeat protein